MAERPPYRKPWEHGAKAYFEADTFKALAEGAKRKRKVFTVLMAREAAGHLPCQYCGIALAEPYEVNRGRGDYTTDKLRFRVAYNPRDRSYVGRHYYCGWGAILQAIADQSRFYIE